MEDIMHIQSAFLRYSENEKYVRVHLDIDAVLSKEDLMAILKQAGVL